MGVMDLCALHVKSTSRSPLLLRGPFHESPISWIAEKTGVSFGIEVGRDSEIGVLKRKVCYKGYQPFIVRAAGKKNHDNSSSSGNGENSIPEGDGVSENNSSDGNKSDSNSDKSHRTNLDWRELRAKLYLNDPKEIAKFDAHSQGGALHSSKTLGTKWAHPISVPETGCVLIATEKYDGVLTSERSVVLLLRSGAVDPLERTFGVVINRPLHQKIKHMKPANLDLVTTFSDCFLHYGGPSEAGMFLLKTGDELKVPGFVEEVIPGLSFGARNSLNDAAELVKKGILKPEDFRFFIGSFEWQLDELRDYIELEYWYVAACSSSLLCGASEGLWDEILQLMGGHYAELSRKPKL